MTADFVNCYADANRAGAYATLEFANTYYLAYRDLPAILAEHVTGIRALDFGCGTGRSTRLLRKLGFTVTGVDVSEDMLRIARGLDPSCDYRLVPDDNFGELEVGAFDLVLSAFTFDNIPEATKTRIFSDLAKLLAPNGTMVSLVSAPEIYTHEWASFTTRDFPQNRFAQSGEEVRIVMKDVPDSRPVVDQVWFPDDYSSLFADCGLDLVDQSTPLGREDEPYDWLAETTVAPWIIYVLGSRP